MMDWVTLETVITVRQAARVAKRSTSTILRWIDAGYLQIVPKWGKEIGYRVFLSEVLECLQKRPRPARGRKGRQPSRCNRKGLWYARSLDRTYQHRLFETAEQREKRLAWQRNYQIAYKWRLAAGRVNEPRKGASLG